ncbi:hypothetical protein HNR07_006357 [Nocardiopsis metallicus]|uniref:Uncharacterized protein n=1 Tax=Nocardiopsis metallicus TaxID=179819 RepID=A0A840WDZ9_9ACTN|nr:hypothetical protein [Nocardiopsis metallicus]
MAEAGIGWPGRGETGLVRGETGPVRVGTESGRVGIGERAVVSLIPILAVPEPGSPHPFVNSCRQVRDPHPLARR